MPTVIKARVQNKTATAAEWGASNPVVLKGEWAIIPSVGTTPPKFKLGDGVTRFNSLPFVNVDVSAYKGVATSATNPGTLTTNQYYSFSTAGTYTNFKDASNASITVAVNEAGNLSYNGSFWTKEVIPVDISGKADTAALNAIDADVYRKAYIDSITNYGTTLSIPLDRTGTTYTLGAVNTSFFGEWSIYTGPNRGLSKINVKCYIAGTITVGFFRIVSGTATLVGKQDFTIAAAGVKVILRSDITAIDLTASESSALYIAIKGGAASITRYIDNGSGAGGYGIIGTITTTAAATTNNLSFSYWIELLAANVPLTAAITANSVAVAANAATILVNSAKIGNIGNMLSGATNLPTGRASGISSPASVVSTGFYFGEYATHYEPAVAPLNKVYIKTRSAGTFSIGFFRLTGGTAFVKLAEKTFTATSAGVMSITIADLSGIDTTFPGESSIYVGFRSSAAGIFSYFDTAVSGTGWSHAPYTDASGTVTTNGYIFDFWIEVTMPAIPIVDAVNSFSAQTVTNEINLVNCSKVVCIGDSYTESFYSLKQKSWINILSGFTDWNFENYGISGFNMPNLISNLRANAAKYEGVAPRDYNGTYAIIASHTNDYTAGIINGTVHLETYLNNLRTLCRIVQSLGMIPIICNEWVDIAIPNATADYSRMIATSMDLLANEIGGIFIDVLGESEKFQGDLSGRFYGGNHPGTRSNSLIWHPIMKNLDIVLPRPRTSLKIYRKRSAVTVSAITDLYYNDVSKRAKLFQEIQVSETRIADAQANYYDDLAAWVALGGARQTVTESDYLKLRKGTAITMTDYSLIEAILPTDSKNITALSLLISDSTVSVYYKDLLNDAWVSATNTAGTITLTASDISKGLDYDKISFLLYKSGGFSLSSVKIKYSGSGGKNNEYKQKKVQRYYSGPMQEQFTFTHEAINSAWVAIGSPAQIGGLNLPTGITGLAEVNNSNYLEQSFANYIPPSNRPRKGVARIWARVTPTAFDSTGTYPSASTIKPDSYDFGTMEVYLKLDNNNVVFSSKNIVPMWNSEISVEFIIPPGITGSWTLGVRSVDSSYIQFMWASVLLDA